MSPAATLSAFIDRCRRNPSPLALTSRIQAYAWGDPRFIPALLGRTPSGAPQAELWWGAHPSAPSTVPAAGNAGLDRLIAGDPAFFLGAGVAARSGGRLPYLLKVLAAAQPLSIQVHPGKAQAAEGFAREAAAAAAGSRTYADGHHKPELLVALTAFHALRGFRSPADIGRELASIPELAGLLDGYSPTAEGLKTLYTAFMELDPRRTDALLSPWVERLAREDRLVPFAKDDRRYWVLRADAAFSRGGVRDKGLFSILLLNHIRLSPGQGIFSPAGVLHAYLEGAGVEVMANSDNVLRGGLTAKPVDVPELLRALTFSGGSPEVAEAREAGGGRRSYLVPVDDFGLEVLSLAPGAPARFPAGHGPDLVAVTAAAAPVRVEGGGPDLLLDQGQAFFAPPAAAYALSSAAPATLYRAFAP